MKRIDKVLGGLFGVACGDALGGTLEFTSKEEGEKLYGFHREIIGGGVMNLKPGEVTDDTIMTIAVAEGILENPENPIEAIGRRFVDWYSTKPNDIGMTCEDSIRRFLQSGDWNEASLYVHKTTDGMTGGNGTLMRCIPAALYYDDYEKMVEITKAQSKMTHYDDKAAEACVLYNTIVYKYLRGEEKIKTIKDTLRGYEDYENIFYTKKEELHPSGYVVDSFKCALWSFINHPNSEDIICEAVNLYGDPDTIGAIAGGLAGTYYGYESLPKRWVEKILIKERLIKIGRKL